MEQGRRIAARGNVLHRHDDGSGVRGFIETPEPLSFREFLGVVVQGKPNNAPIVANLGDLDNQITRPHGEGGHEDRHKRQ